MKKRILFDSLLDKIPNKYELTIVTGKRVRKLSIDNKSMTNAKTQKTLVQIALKEVLDGKISVGRVIEEA
jgi:DNA-directed RNA polymerase subunit omega